MRTKETTQGDFGCGLLAGGSTDRSPACTFRVVGAVKDYDDTFERFEIHQVFRPFGDPELSVGEVEGGAGVRAARERVTGWCARRLRRMSQSAVGMRPGLQA